MPVHTHTITVSIYVIKIIPLVTKGCWDTNKEGTSCSSTHQKHSFINHVTIDKSYTRKPLILYQDSMKSFLTFPSTPM
jgi:hypothetical protein